MSEQIGRYKIIKELGRRGLAVRLPKQAEYGLAIILITLGRIKQSQERIVDRPVRQRNNKSNKKPSSNRGRQRICLLSANRSEELSTNRD